MPYCLLGNVSGAIRLVDGIEYYYLETMAQILNFSYEVIDYNIRYENQMLSKQFELIIENLSKNVIVMPSILWDSLLFPCILNNQDKVSLLFLGN